MRHNLTRFETWMLRKIFGRLVVQSREHQANIIEAYRLLAEASRAEFTEDNEATQYDFLREQFEAAADEMFTYHETIREAINKEYV